MPQRQLDYRTPFSEQRAGGFRRRGALVLLVSTVLTSLLWALSYLWPTNQFVFAVGDTAYWLQSSGGSLGLYARWFWMPGEERAVLEFLYWHPALFLLLSLVLVGSRIIQSRRNAPAA